MYHTRFEIWWWSDRDGLVPFNIEYVAANSVISENGGLREPASSEQTEEYQIDWNVSVPPRP